MRLLLKAALRTRRHLVLLLITFSTLILLTIASQLEMFALGVLSNNGSDFFAFVCKMFEVFHSFLRSCSGKFLSRKACIHSSSPV